MICDTIYLAKYGDAVVPPSIRKNYISHTIETYLAEDESSRVLDTNVEGRLDKQDFAKPDAFS